MITLEEAKLHLRVDHDEEDSLIGIYLESAYERVRYFIDQDIPDPEPASIKSAALLYLGDLYENREAQIVSSGYSQFLQNKAAESLLMPFRVGMGI